MRLTLLLLPRKLLAPALAPSSISCAHLRTRVVPPAISASAMVKTSSFNRTISSAISLCSCHHSLFRLLPSLVSLATRRFACSTRAPTTQCGRFGPLLALVSPSKASLSSLLMLLCLSTAPLHSFFPTIESHTETTSVTRWRFPACLLPPSTRLRCLQVSTTVRESVKVNTKLSMIKTSGTSCFRKIQRVRSPLRHPLDMTVLK